MAGPQSLFGIFPNRESVEEAIKTLRLEGFAETDLAVLLSDAATRDLAHEKRSKALEGFGIGAAIGAVLIGALTWAMATNRLGGYQLPYTEWVVGLEPVLAALAGMGAGGLLGSLIGLSVGISIPEYEAKRYQGRLRKKGILLSVHCENADQRNRARAILERTGGEKIAARRESSGDYNVQPLQHPRQASVNSRKVEPWLFSQPADSMEKLSPPRSAATGQQPGEWAAKIADGSYDRPSNLPIGISARDLMSTNIKVVKDSATLTQAAEEMRKAGTSILLVGSENSIAGVITDRDIAVRASAEGYDPSTTNVSAVMTSPFAYCREDQDVAEVANIMEEKHIHRLPVLDRAMRLVGMISLKDLATKAKNPRFEGQILRLVANERD